MLSYVHGSADSLDTDVMYIFDEIPTRAEATKFCSGHSDNRNIAVVRDGVVVYTYKGTADEVNNALFMTISLHPENPESIITRLVERNFVHKAIRVLRGSIGAASRSELRQRVKSALRSYDWQERVDVFADINYRTHTNDDGRGPVEVFKFLAFQWGQLLALEQKVELYTKSDIADFYPILRPYLYRVPTPFDDGLSDIYESVLSCIRDIHYSQDVSIVHFVDYNKMFNIKDEYEL